jgi:hypothetical protein
MVGDVAGATKRRPITHNEDGITKSPTEQFSGLEENVPRTSIAALHAQKSSFLSSISEVT